MGKQQQEQSEKQQEQIQQPKKIIKKFPFKNMKSNKKQEGDDDLKNWKPTKISEKQQNQKKQLQKQKSNISQSFLSCLAKPKNQQKQLKLPFNENDIKLLLKNEPKKMVLTQQQIKWDIQDQSFIKKQFQKQDRKELQHELIEEQDQQQIVQKIEWLNEPKNKMKQIDLTKVIQNNWKRAATKGQFQAQIWDKTALSGKGQLSQFVKQAIEKFEDDQQLINRRSKIKKNIKSRYGW